MRLLCTDDDGGLSIKWFSKDLIPEYAILSHTWGRGEDDEVTYKNVINKTGDQKPGFKKLEFCAKQAKADDLHYCWMDICCINKANSTKLTTAINSMFKWYQNAARCYVYLSDVSVRTQNDQSSYVE